LNSYGQREYKFSQSASFQPVRDKYGNQFNNGVCMGVTMNWIKEKLSTSNGLLNAKGRLRNSQPRQFSSPLNPIARLKQGISPPTNSVLNKLLKKGKSGRRNEQAMLDGAHSHGIYSGKSVQVLSAELGLGASSYSPNIKARKGRGYLPESMHPETIAAAGLGLPKGQALLIEIEHKKVNSYDPDSAGHAVAFYRSAGDTLYFFDPNAGVYRIPKPGEPARHKRDNVDIPRSLTPPGQRSAETAPLQETSDTNETNALRFVKQWLDVYDNGRGLKWEISKDWQHGYDHIIPKPDAKGEGA
jgi:hypothetical protein